MTWMQMRCGMTKIKIMEDVIKLRLESLKLAVDLKYGSIEMTLSAAQKMYNWLTQPIVDDDKPKQINS